MINKNRKAKYRQDTLALHCKYCNAIVYTQRKNRQNKSITEPLCWGCIAAIINNNSDVNNGSYIDREKIKEIAKKTIPYAKVRIGGRKKNIIHRVLKRLPKVGEVFSYIEFRDIYIGIRIDDGEKQLSYAKTYYIRKISYGYLSKLIERGYIRKIPNEISTYTKLIEKPKSQTNKNKSKK